MLNTEYVKDWRKRVKIAIVKGFGGSCCVCGYNRSINALEFHHLIPEEKEFSFGAIRASKGWDQLIIEIGKCVMLCSNCHKEVHDVSCDTQVPIDAPRFDVSLTGWISKGKKYDVCFCGKKKLVYRKYCSQTCSSSSRIKVEWDKIDLIKMVDDGTRISVALQLGVSDKTVGKRYNKLVRMRDQNTINE